MRRSPLALLLPLAACAQTPPVATASSPTVAARPIAIRTGAAVIGATAANLAALFGKPSGEVAEGEARRLQFSGPACILDAYLYPPAAGGPPIVTHIDTRQPTGADIDQASCIAALKRR